jgi:hypothetical protein
VEVADQEGERERERERERKRERERERERERARERGRAVGAERRRGYLLRRLMAAMVLAERARLRASLATSPLVHSV